MSFRKDPSTPKDKKKESQITPKKHPYVAIDQPLKQIFSFNDIHISKYCSSIIIKGKRIQNFVGLPAIENLTILNLDSNPIKNFKGAPRLPSLRWLSIRNTPISRSEYFKLMCLVAFGTNIVTINDMKAPQKCKEQALIIEKDLLPELQKGRIITNLKPLRLIDTDSSDRVSPRHGLMAATLKMGYNAPSDKEYTEAFIRPDRCPAPVPSVAVICEEIAAREDEECYLPSDVVSTFSEQLSKLRSTYNAQYESTASSDVEEEKDEKEEEEEEEEEDKEEAETKTELDIDNSSNKIQALSEDDPEVQALSNQLMDSDSESGGNISQNSNVEEEENEQNDVNEEEDSDEKENDENISDFNEEENSGENENDEEEN